VAPMHGDPRAVVAGVLLLVLLVEVLEGAARLRIARWRALRRGEKVLIWRPWAGWEPGGCYGILPYHLLVTETRLGLTRGALWVVADVPLCEVRSFRHFRRHPEIGRECVVVMLGGERGYARGAATLCSTRGLQDLARRAEAAGLPVEWVGEAALGGSSAP